MSGKQMGKSVSVSRTCEAITSQHGDVISRCGAEMYKWLPTVDGETIAFCYDHALALGTSAIGWNFPTDTSGYDWSRAVTALENWGRHFDWCESRTTSEPFPCNCGLARELEDLRNTAVKWSQ